MRVSKQIILISTAGALVLGALAIGFAKQQQDVAETVPLAPAKVFAQPALTKPVSDALTFPARVVSKISASILSESDGIIGHIPVRLGERVFIRKQLMQIFHTDPILQYAPLNVRAPLAGVISSIDVTEGAQVTRGQKLASVTDPSQIRIVIEVPTEDRSRIQVGTVSEFRYGKDRVAKAKLQGLGPFIDPATGTASCEFDVEPSLARGLAPGMVGRISIQTNHRTALQVPEYAVIYRNQLPFVRILEHGKIRFAAVQLGSKIGEQVEIVSGIQEGESVVERSSRFVAEGELVETEAPQNEAVHAKTAPHAGS